MSTEAVLDTNVLLYAAVLAATQQLGAATLYSEDLSHAQDYDGVRVVNPFLEVEVQAAPPSP